MKAKHRHTDCHNLFDRYRAPEVILCQGNYGPSIDMWSVGCIFAELIQVRIFCPARIVQVQVCLDIANTCTGKIFLADACTGLSRYSEYMYGCVTKEFFDSVTYVSSQRLLTCALQTDARVFALRLLTAVLSTAARMHLADRGQSLCAQSINSYRLNDCSHAPDRQIPGSVRTDS